MAGKSQIKRGAIFSYINMLVTVATGFIMSPLMRKAWGNDTMGLYFLIGSMVGYISLLDFGLGDCIVRYVAKYRAQNDKKAQDNFVNMSFTLYLFISIMVAAVGLLLFFTYHRFFKGKTPEAYALMDKMFLIVLANLVVSFVFQVFPGILNAYEEFVFIRKLELLRNILRPVIVVALLANNIGPVAVVVLDAAFNMAYYIATMLYAVIVHRVRVRVRGIDYSIFRELFSYSFFVFLAYAVNQVYWKADHAILGKFSTDSQIAVSQTGTQFANYFIQISTTLAALFLPRVTKMVVDGSSGKALTNAMIKIGRIQFLVLGLVFTGFTIVGKQFIMQWMDDESYINSYYVAVMLMVALFVPEIQTLGMNILFAKNMHRFRSVMLVFISILNIIISIPLAKSYGALGAAIGTALSLAVGNGLILNIYYSRAVGIEMKRFFKETLRGILPVMIASLALGSLTFFIPQFGGWFSVILRCAIVGAIYCGLQWLFGMNEYEKELLFSLVKKFLKKSKKAENQVG